ncbi:MAG TPA: hypothetical protein VGP64_10270 [Polyangia bacterium]
MPDNDAPPEGTGQPLSRRPAWIILAVIAVIALAVWSFRGKSSGGGAGAGPGAVDGTAINLVTSDRDDLACASDKSFGKYRCEFKAPGVPWPNPPAPADRLAGYYTMDQKLMVIPGLFEQPALAARYTQEQARNLPRDQRPRFSASCQFKTIDHLKDFQTRWLKTGEWGHQDEAPVAVASDCKLQ